MVISCSKCGLQYDVRSYPEGTQVQCRCSTILTVPSHVISTVRCPSCGGTVDASSQRCQFCQSMLSRKTCPKCFAAVREEAKFCDQCATPIKAIAANTAKATDHDCPRCKVPLFDQILSGYAVESCDECLGLWISHETLEHIYRDSPRRVESVKSEQLAVAETSAATQTLAPGAAAYIPCPICNGIMNPTNYARRSGVIIDVCRDHGTWFDADELNKILEFTARGGVEQSRLKDLDKAKMELQQQRLSMRLEAGRQQHQTSHASLFTASLSSWNLR